MTLVGQRGKEVHYFDNEKNFIDEPNYEIYHKSFDFSQNKIIYGEATPIYMYWKDVAERIYAYNKEMKIILLLRNPIERAYSHWNMNMQKNIEDMPFIEVLLSEEKKIINKLSLEHRRFSYIDRGFYVNQVKKMWEYFGEKNVLILKSEELNVNHQNILNDITDFLQISKFCDVLPNKEHARKYSETMSQESYEFLSSTYKDEIENIETLLGWDCSTWLQSYSDYISKDND